MDERRTREELDAAVERLMADPHAPAPHLDPHLDPQLVALLRIAGDLRDLPRDGVKARLADKLLAPARLRPVAPAGGRPLATPEDIQARLAAMADEPRLFAHDVRAALADLPEMTMRFLAPLNRCTLGVSRFSEPSHWERHPAGDELLYLVDGDADVVTLTPGGPVTSTACAGSIFVCRQGLWHRVVPRSPLSLLFATPGEGTEHAPVERTPGAPGSGAAPVLAAHDLRAAAAGLRELTITRSTTAAEADAAVRTLTALDGCTLGVMRFSGETPWERHPDGDELLHPLDGDVDVTVLAEEGPTRVTVRAGSVFVCPRGLWHRQLPRTIVIELFATPTATTEVSWADDPRPA